MLNLPLRAINVFKHLISPAAYKVGQSSIWTLQVVAQVNKHTQALYNIDLPE